MLYLSQSTEKSILSQSELKNTLNLFGMTFYYFEKGKLCGHSQAFDQLGFLGQIGVLGINIEE